MQYTPIRICSLYAVACFEPISTTAMIGLSAASTAVSAAGTLAGGDAAMAASQRKYQQAEYQAKQAEQDAQQSRALAQRAALEKRRQGALAESRAVAEGAAGGGGVGASDPTILNLVGKLAGEAAYRALSDVNKGDIEANNYLAKAMQLRTAGAEALIEGANAKSQSQMKALGTVLNDGASMFGKFSKPEKFLASFR